MSSYCAIAVPEIKSATIAIMADNEFNFIIKSWMNVIPVTLLQVTGTSYGIFDAFSVKVLLKCPRDLLKVLITSETYTIRTFEASLSH